MIRRVVVGGAVAAVLLAGCSGPSGQQQSPPPPPPPPPPPRSAADAAACEAHTQRAVLLRREADAYASMAVPPVRVALVLAATWEFYNAPGAEDPVLVAALTEVAAAIGDLDAQGKAKVPEGGSLMDPVQLDATRIQAAAAAADEACA